MDVDKILSASKLERKSTDVSKEVELQFDLGNLLATDLNSLDTEALRWLLLILCTCILTRSNINFRKNKDGYLKQIMRENTQLLINKVWEVSLIAL